MDLTKPTPDKIELESTLLLNLLEVDALAHATRVCAERLGDRNQSSERIGTLMSLLSDRVSAAQGALRDLENAAA